MRTSDKDSVTALKPVGRRARKAIAVRQALFGAGLAAFERQPIGLVSVLDITESADVAKGVFYLQFKSKDDYLLALWQEVQRRFLDSLREATGKSRSLAARATAVVQHIQTFVRESPASARFWIRMFSYFPDEVGPPGHLTRIRHEYAQQFAAILSGKSVDKQTAGDLDRAIVLDSVCWAVVSTQIQYDEPLIDDKKFLATVRTLISG